MTRVFCTATSAVQRGIWMTNGLIQLVVDQRVMRMRRITRMLQNDLGPGTPLFFTTSHLAHAQQIWKGSLRSLETMELPSAGSMILLHLPFSGRRHLLMRHKLACLQDTKYGH
uniref:Uncharacterized protein n=1 Tax=Aegilops tauschii subsp. strangulata TaxID=200361 RepID=A0A453GU54_AEGTS